MSYVKSILANHAKAYNQIRFYFRRNMVEEKFCSKGLIIDIASKTHIFCQLANTRTKVKYAQHAMNLNYPNNDDSLHN